MNSLYVFICGKLFTYAYFPRIAAIHFLDAQQFISSQIAFHEHSNRKLLVVGVFPLWLLSFSHFFISHCLLPCVLFIKVVIIQFKGAIIWFLELFFLFCAEDTTTNVLSLSLSLSLTLSLPPSLARPLPHSLLSDLISWVIYFYFVLKTQPRMFSLSLSNSLSPNIHNYVQGVWMGVVGPICKIGLLQNSFCFCKP